MSVCTGLVAATAVALAAALAGPAVAAPAGAGHHGATRAAIDAAQKILDAGAATRERDQLLSAIRSQTQLLNAALTVQRLAQERAKPDAARETGYQQRDEALIEGRLKQVQRRYRSEVEKEV
ncbi:S46 family peptidase, partial [Streptomyces mirabilis]|uniref:S46 family peptidase n=1 Tax=Streptomyces mirabilis TaxID=68239 RepID=UPI0036BD5CDB